MALSFEKCFALLKASNITTYQIQREHIVASETWKKMQVGKDINTAVSYTLLLPLLATDTALPSTLQLMAAAATAFCWACSPKPSLS